MYKRIIATISALLMGITLTLVGTQPAQALVSTACTSYYGVGIATDDRFCMDVGWYKQADGQGVVIDFINVWPQTKGEYESDSCGSAVIERMWVYNNIGNVVWTHGTTCMNTQGGRIFNVDVGVNQNCALVKVQVSPRVNNYPDPGIKSMQRQVCD